jgi:hypothetical protein
MQIDGGLSPPIPAFLGGEMIDLDTVAGTAG